MRGVILPDRDGMAVLLAYHMGLLTQGQARQALKLEHGAFRDLLERAAEHGRQRVEGARDAK